MILFIDQSGELGGAELCLADLAAHRADARVLLLADGPFARLLEDRKIPVQILPLPDSARKLGKRASLGKLLVATPSLLRHFFQLRQRIQTADLLYFNTAKALLAGTLANFPFARPGVFHLHDLLTAEHFSASAIRLLIAAANRTRAVIANSQITADAFVAAGGRVPTYVIPNGFDPAAHLPASPDTIAALRKEFGAGNSTIAAVFGRLSRWKGQDLLIAAAAAIPELQVWIVGDALFTDDDQLYAKELRATVERRQLGDRIRFLGFRRDIPALMQAADLIVHTSRSPEPFGRVIVEGMLAGRPVVAPSLGGPLEIIEPQVTGLLFEPDNITALTECLVRLKSDPELSAKMGQLGRKLALKRYSLSDILQQTDKVIESVLSTPPVP